MSGVVAGDVRPVKASGGGLIGSGWGSRGKCQPWLRWSSQKPEGGIREAPISLELKLALGLSTW